MTNLADVPGIFTSLYVAGIATGLLVQIIYTGRR